MVCLFQSVLFWIRLLKRQRRRPSDLYYRPGREAEESRFLRQPKGARHGLRLSAPVCRVQGASSSPPSSPAPWVPKTPLGALFYSLSPRRAVGDGGNRALGGVLGTRGAWPHGSMTSPGTSLEAPGEDRHALVDPLVRIRKLAPSLALGLPPAAEVHLATDPLDAAHQVDARGGARVQARVEM